MNSSRLYNKNYSRSFARIVFRMNSAINYENVVILSKYPSEFFFLKDCINCDEENLLLNAFAKPLKRRKYEGNHWDDVISKYKEIQVIETNYQPEVQDIINKCKTIVSKALKKEINFLPPHLIDLAQDGQISPHVDSIKFSGDLIAGLSLLSTRILRLEQCVHEDNIVKGSGDKPHPTYFEIYLPPRSMYILRGSLRYDFTHAILGINDSPYSSSITSPISLSIDRRLSMMLRDAKEEDEDD